VSVKYIDNIQTSTVILSLPLSGRLLMLLVGTILIFPQANAYRPFTSTDADVADAYELELEIELGYFAVERRGNNDTFVIPQLVFNYGLTNTLEVVGEFDVEKSDGRSFKIVDAAVLFKGLLKQGVLQDNLGISVAYEAGVLIPSTGSDRFGVEAIGIVSGSFPRFIYHLNFGAGMDAVRGREFAIWAGFWNILSDRTSSLLGRSMEKYQKETVPRPLLL
jgi:hypothetical protein